MQADSQPDSKTSTPAAGELRDADNASAQRRASALPLPQKDQTLETSTKAPRVRLPSLGEEVEAGVSEATNRVEIRRKGRATYSFANQQALDDFAGQRQLSEVDREALHGLELVAQAKRIRVVAVVHP